MTAVAPTLQDARELWHAMGVAGPTDHMALVLCQAMTSVQRFHLGAEGLALRQSNPTVVRYFWSLARRPDLVRLDADDQVVQDALTSGLTALKITGIQLPASGSIEEFCATVLNCFVAVGESIYLQQLAGADTTAGCHTVAKNVKDMLTGRRKKVPGQLGFEVHKAFERNQIWRDIKQGVV